MKFYRALLLTSIQLALISLSGCAGSPVISVPTSNMPQKAEDSIVPEPVKNEVTAETRKNFNQAIKYLKDGELDSALEILVSINKQNPGLAGPLINIGIAYHKKGEDDKAISHLEYAIKENHENIAAYKVLASIYKEQGKFKAARNVYLEGLNVNPDDKDINYNLGILNELYLRDYPAAITHYKRYLSAVGTDDNVEMWVKGLNRRINNK